MTHRLLLCDGQDFRRQGLLFPRRLRSGLRKGELVWGRSVHSRVLQVLHNPRYAGAFFHGRTRSSGVRTVVAVRSSDCHPTSGTRCCPRAMPGTSTGTSTSATKRSFGKTPRHMATIDATVHREEGRLSCKDGLVRPVRAADDSLLLRAESRVGPEVRVSKRGHRA